MIVELCGECAALAEQHPFALSMRRDSAASFVNMMNTLESTTERAGQFSEALDALLALSHDLGRSAHDWAILGEGNTSARVDDETFLVKASGSQLATLAPDQLVHVRLRPILGAVASDAWLSDDETRQLLTESCIEAGARMPSVETLFHADLLGSFGARFVGHTHVISVNSLLCSRFGWSMLQEGGRLFPDEVVVCGVAPCCVPYVDPGLPLARAIHSAVEEFRSDYGTLPKTVYLQNHGLIAIGNSAAEALAITRMADKSAKIMLGAIACGGPQFLSAEDVARIAGRPDERLRQRSLGLSVSG